MNWMDYLPLLALLTSLVSAAIIFSLRDDRVRTRTIVNLTGSGLKLALIGMMLWGVLDQQQYEFHFPIMPGMEFVLRADSLAMFFVTLSGLLWFLTTIYAVAYLEGSRQRSRFFGFFSLCVSATVGLALSGNLFTFVIFYELLTLATYPLVVHKETNEARRAGRIYLAYTLSGGVLLLLGSVWLHVLVPGVDFKDGTSLADLGEEFNVTLRIIFFLLVAGLGVKAALFPLHGWLPQSMVAPAPVSALLHAVAVVKAGAFGIVRVVYDVYGIDRAHALDVMLPLAIWASVTIIYGSLRALSQDEIKRRLAFSTVSQVSYIALGVALLGPSSTVGGVVHLVHQGLMKITLFFCAGNLDEVLGIKKISQMRGVGRRMPWTMAAFTTGALGMIGLPPLCGFISKWYLGSGAIEASQHWVLVVLVASTLLNAAYFLPMIYLAWFCTAAEADPKSANPGRRRDASWGLLLPPLVTAALAVVTGVMAGAEFSPLQWAVLVVERNYGREVIDRGMVESASQLSVGNAMLVSVIIVPLLLAGLSMFRPVRGVVVGATALGAVPALGLVCFGELGTTLSLDWLLLRTHLGLDTTGHTFLLFTAVLWLLAGIYVRGSMADDPQASRFCCFFLLTMAGNFGLILSQDMASFYAFFALMSFAAYPLVIHQGNEESRRAGRVYMVLVAIGEAALVAAMLLAVVARDSLLFGQGAERLDADPAAPWIVGLLVIGFGIKVGVIPLHVWLPLAHPAAPIPASAVLSGAMIKAGLLGWLRYLPVGQMELPAWGNLFLVLGLVTAFYGVVVGVMQQRSKAVLAYSSISQMGLLTCALGAGLLVPTAWTVILPAILLYVLHHGFSKACLFLSVGVAPHLAGGGWLQRLSRLGLVIPALAIAGAPLTIGALGKGALKDAFATLPQSWAATMYVLLPLAGIGTTLLMARFLYLVWPRAQVVQARIKWPVLISWSGSLITVLAGVWLLPAQGAKMGGATLLFDTMIWANLWPVVVGLLVACMVGFGFVCFGDAKSGTGTLATGMFGRDGKRKALPSIPAGDLLVIWSVARPVVSRYLHGVVKRIQHMQATLVQQFSRLPKLAEIRLLLQSAESIMEGWPWVALAISLLIAVSYLVA